MDDGLIQVQVRAIRASCARLSAPQLQALQHSVVRASQLPRSGWARKAAAHAEIFSLLAGIADDPVLARQLMVVVGPAVDGMTASSRQRLLGCLRAGDPEGAAHEMETHLRVLTFMGHCAAGPIRTG
jgi:DNA-binding GntR family transcriptional regulator